MCPPHIVSPVQPATKRHLSTERLAATLKCHLRDVTSDCGGYVSQATREAALTLCDTVCERQAEHRRRCSHVKACRIAKAVKPTRTVACALLNEAMYETTGCGLPFANLCTLAAKRNADKRIRTQRPIRRASTDIQCLLSGDHVNGCGQYSD